jgi:hypothetical protein
MSAQVARVVAMPPRHPARRVAKPTPKVAIPGFRPRRRDWLLLEAVQQVVAEGGRLTNAALGTRVGVSREAVRKRLAKNPQLRAWLNAQLEAAIADAWPSILARAVALALRGSIRHMEFLAEVRGVFGSRRGLGRGGAA